MKTIWKLTLTFAIIGIALFLGYNRFKEYINNPWTRDGQVRTQVIQVAPRVSGMVINIAVKDNDFVEKGSLLFEIDPSQYKIKLKQAKARLQRTLESAKGSKIEYDRVKRIYSKDKGAISKKDYDQKEVNYYKSLSSIESSKESLENAKLQLSYTKVYAEVEGYISNINFQLGTQAVVNHPILALVDSNAYWVFGYFREDAIVDIEVGDTAKVILLAYPNTPIDAEVESIGWGVSHADGNPGSNLLPSIQPVFHWIRLAQRIPVRIKLGKLPENMHLRFGLSASVVILK
ncbi:MAG: HlyD family secretion protein [Campylobacterota bacterium]|nr:HlyD family secretion protein [Campylobacterota bacterium]